MAWLGLGVVLVVAIGYSAPMRLRVQLGRGAMGTSFRDRRVGLYRARRIDSIPDGMRFVVRHCYQDYVCRLAFSPRHAPVSDMYTGVYRHLAGPWYRWRGPPGAARARHRQATPVAWPQAKPGPDLRR